MKTALFTTCYLDGTDTLGNDRLHRNLRYVNYYSSIKRELGFDDIWMYDNASSYKSIEILSHQDAEINIQLNTPHYPRGEGPYNYPYCWRGLYFLRDLIKDKGYEKILIIDSDFFVLSRKLAHWLRDVDKGWQALWCPRHGFPEASCQALTKESFPIYFGFTALPWEKRLGECIERTLPFTHEVKDFVCDRYGEDGPVPITKEMDAYAQMSMEVTPRFEGGK